MKMKIAKGVLLVIACLAIALSLVPRVAQGISPQNQTTPSSTWTVTCRYDEYDHYLGKTCTSGGNDSCACP